MYTNNSTLSVLKIQMSWLTKRQELLASNVANAETPGYQPRDLRRVDFESMIAERNSNPSVRSTDMRVTQKLHLTPVKSASAFETKIASPFDVSASGNAVALEEEMVKVANTQLEHRAVSELYSRAVAILKYSAKSTTG